MRIFRVWTSAICVLIVATACLPMTEFIQANAFSDVAPHLVALAASQPFVSAAPPPPSPNVAVYGSGRASAGNESAQLGIDGNEDTIWSAQAAPSQWYQVFLDDFYMVDKIEMVVTQAPAGPTTHEVWLGNDSGVLTLFTRLTDLYTEDGQTLELSIPPMRAVNEVLILTRDSPSWVAWREVRVFGSHSQAE